VKCKTVFDNNERLLLESVGLNCVYIDKQNKDCLLRNLSYINTDNPSFKANKNIQSQKLLDKKFFNGFGIGRIFLPVLIVDPSYFYDIYIEIIKKYKVQSLILDATMSVFLKKPTAKRKVLRSIDFIKDLYFLKLFYLQPQKDMMLIDFWDIDDFSPIEHLKELECLYIPTNDLFVDIDFSQLKQLKEFDLQFPKENKTIYQCQNIESAETRYYEADFSMIQNWKSLKRFGAYFDKLKSFEGLENFKHLKEFKGQFTSKLKSFEGLKSKSIETFFYYSEVRNTPTSLEGISGLENVKLLKFSGLKKLETIADLTQCSTLEEVWFEESKVPSDIEKLAQMPNLKKVFIDYPGDVVKQYPKLKPLMQWVLGK
jgi:hypothetical protein